MLASCYLIDTCSYSIEHHAANEDVHSMRSGTYYATYDQEATSLSESLAIESVVPLNVRSYNQSHIAATD